MPILARSVFWLVLGTGGLVTTSIARAHAIVVEATPRNSSVAGARVPIDLRFNSRIDTRRSRLAVIEPHSDRYFRVGRGLFSLARASRGFADPAVGLVWLYRES